MQLGKGKEFNAIQCINEISSTIHKYYDILLFESYLKIILKRNLFLSLKMFIQL